MTPTTRIFGSLLTALALAGVGSAQSTEDLIAQLSGKAPAPARSAAELSRAYQTAVTALLPRMGGADVAARYEQQIHLQNMALVAARPGAEAERKALAEVLVKTLDQPMDPTVQYWIILQLQRMGDGECVPALSARLQSSDRHLRDYARRALEKNPDLGATMALVKALSASRDAVWRAALIHSLGERRDAVALKAMTRALQDGDAAVRAAAVAALVRVGTGEAEVALVKACEGGGAAQPAVAQGLLDLAQQREAANPVSAARLYAVVYDAAGSGKLLPSLREAALLGRARTNPSAALTAVGRLAARDDSDAQALAVKAALVAATPALAQSLSARIGDLGPEAQTRLLVALRRRGEASGLATATRMLTADAEAVRVAAIEAVAALGGVAEVDGLLAPAANASGEVQKAAQRGLARITGRGVDEALLQRAGSGAGAQRVAAIAALAERQCAAATGTLLRAAADADSSVARASFKALQGLAGAADIPALVRLVVQGSGGAAEDTLRIVLARLDDAQGAVATVLNSARRADAAGRAALIATLNGVGGAEALAYVTEQTRAGNATVAEAAQRALSDWSRYEAVQPLLAMVQAPGTSTKYQVLGLRGIARLIKQSTEVSADQRVSDCLAALAAARRPDERKLAVATLGAVGTATSREKLLALARSGDLRREAGLALLDMAKGLERSDRRTAQSLARSVAELDISADLTKRAQDFLGGRR